MRSQNIQKDLSLIGDNLINKFIQKDKILDGIIDYFYEEKKFTGFLECCETVINFPFNVMKTFTC